ncbi:hypothetical protein HanRHA438_Chr14g0635581 [Helianthus annuus]|uniref:Uncharacterized protein n=1 Tax=Helianthus annuus TaxID=4232 RepID=A0A251VK51_HELAN|nr:uncharacterized protein LOC110943510 isoform X1 [Helianthus annuus]KAF5767549.1 hypothetical protein HanXRQr2_Chr14g0625611 [Helianthus annuus]KAJ0484443.1 hypothetical protein HanHA89_Chr14g0544151 [Helianthus annuus]KAJ0654996.1 hypothetical protein HanLR1_Chr14g0513421 [Helianthus annuus]KAJ0702384.1 hypothetical protein HanPI659440_Chr14g0528891 [Helianthus annuus]KAJ0838912.1 hypothetical protein HanPSC8_Chr14g0600381 [Helianthus annuus]
MSISATSTTFNPLSSLYTLSPITTNLPHSSVSTPPLRYNGARLLGFVPRAVSSQDQGVFDSELHSVLQLATGSELYEVERILFGTSYFSPLLKSIAKPSNVDYVMIEEDPEEREEFISILEARFFFLAADARSSLRGWRPTYRNVLLGVRKELKIPCSTKLSTEDLEIEIFLHLLQEYSSEGSGSLKRGSDSLEVGLSPWKVQAFAALGRGAEEFITMVLKGGGMFTVGRLYNLISSKLSGKVFLEAANYQIKKEVLKEGGRLAAINLESRAALLAAKQGLKGAASRYLGVRSIMVLLGPMLWGTFLADLVIQMLGTDYARILRAIYAFAQIRISRTYRLPSDSS